MISTFHIEQTSTKVLVRKKKETENELYYAEEVVYFCDKHQTGHRFNKKCKKKKKKRKVQSQMNIDNVQYCKKK